MINGTEGEPGSAKDKMLLLRSPYLVLGGALIAARALGAKEIVVGMATGEAGRTSARSAARPSPRTPACGRWSGSSPCPTGSSPARAARWSTPSTARIALPPGPQDPGQRSGVAGQPTLLSNAETFAQIAVLSMLGPEGYASAGTPDEPGTVLLSVGGSARYPAVVEVPLGAPLGHVLGICDAHAAEGVLVGGYHGMWLTAEVAARSPVSRAGLAAAGGTLGAGIVLPLGRYLPAGRGRPGGQLPGRGVVGPVRPVHARPARYRPLASRAGPRLRRPRRHGYRPPGRRLRSRPGRLLPPRRRVPLRAVGAGRVHRRPHRAPVPRQLRPADPWRAAAAPGGATAASVDWTRCRGHGLCAHLVPELVQLDRQGFPVPWTSRCRLAGA